MIRIVENNDWVVITLLLVVAMFLAMFNWLQRDVPFLKFLVQSNQESQNTFLCWLIISLGFSVSLSVLLSQYIPILPRFIEERELFGFTLNKMGLQ